MDITIYKSNITTTIEIPVEVIFNSAGLWLKTSDDVILVKDWNEIRDCERKIFPVSSSL